MKELQRITYATHEDAMRTSYTKKFTDIFGKRHPAGTYVYVSGCDIVAAEVPRDATPQDEDVFVGTFGL